MSSGQSLFVIGEANFSDHGANRLGASALMQGLSDGYFILPYTVGDYIAKGNLEKIDAAHPEFTRAEAEVAQLTKRLLSVKGRQTVDTFHRQLGKIMWDGCGMTRSAQVLKSSSGQIRDRREPPWEHV